MGKDKRVLRRCLLEARKYRGKGFYKGISRGRGQKGMRGREEYLLVIRK